MAATNRPRLYTERPVCPMTPDDLCALDEIAAARGVPRTEAVRTLIRAEHARHTARLARRAAGGPAPANDITDARAALQPYLEWKRQQIAAGVTDKRKLSCYAYDEAMQATAGREAETEGDCDR